MSPLEIKTNIRKKQERSIAWRHPKCAASLAEDVELGTRRLHFLFRMVFIYFFFHGFHADLGFPLPLCGRKNAELAGRRREGLLG